MTSHLVIIPTRRAHSNHAEVARSLGVDIIAGRYAEGTRLPGDAVLIAMFGVSRPVLRESVKTLVAKGLLSTKARVGTVVRERGAWNMFDADVLAWHLDAGIDKRFLADLAEIRLAVEPRAAALAAVRRSEADLAELQRSMDRMRREASELGRLCRRRPCPPHRCRQCFRQSVHAFDRKCDRGGATCIIPAQCAGRATGSRDGAAMAPAHRRCGHGRECGSGGGGHHRGHSQRSAAARRAGGCASGCQARKLIGGDRNKSCTAI